MNIQNRFLILSAVVACAALACALPDPFASATISEDPPVASGSPTETITVSGTNPFLPTATATPDPNALEKSLDEVTGEVSATLDGEQRSWQTGIFLYETGPVSLAVWRPFPLTIGGELYEVQVDALPQTTALEIDEEQENLLVGLHINFIFANQGAGRTINYSISTEEDGLSFESANIFLQVEENDEVVSYMMTAGQLEVTTGPVTPGEDMLVEGSFAGILTFIGNVYQGSAPDPSRTIEVTDGRFMIERLIFAEQ